MQKLNVVHWFKNEYFHFSYVVIAANYAKKTNKTKQNKNKQKTKKKKKTKKQTNKQNNNNKKKKQKKKPKKKKKQKQNDMVGKLEAGTFCFCFSAHRDLTDGVLLLQYFLVFLCSSVVWLL